MWKFSELKEKRIALISCIAMWFAFFGIHLILFKCGAFYRLF